MNEISCNCTLMVLILSLLFRKYLSHHLIFVEDASGHFQNCCLFFKPSFSMILSVLPILSVFSSLKITLALSFMYPLLPCVFTCLLACISLHLSASSLKEENIFHLCIHQVQYNDCHEASTELFHVLVSVYWAVGV